jgi:hypothetical protein
LKNVPFLPQKALVYDSQSNDLRLTKQWFGHAKALVYDV